MQNKRWKEAVLIKASLETESRLVLSFLIWWANKFIFCLSQFLLDLCHFNQMSPYFWCVYELLSHQYLNLRKNAFPFVSLLVTHAASVFKVHSVLYSTRSENSPLLLSCLQLFTLFARISTLYILIIFSQNL